MFCKMLNDGYVSGVCVSKIAVGEEITENEYNEILSVINNRPIAPDGYGYRLCEDLTWELYELPVVEISDEITNEEAYNIIMGVRE